MASFTVVAAEDIKSDEESNQFGSLTTELSCLTRQDGSANLVHGDTSILCVTYGPAEVRINKECIDKATIEVVYKPKVGLPRPVDRKWERIIRNVFASAIITSLHPRSAISIIVQETEDMGSKLACAINAACLALLDAAISMNYMVAAVATCVNECGKICVDPTKKMEDECLCYMTFVFDSSNLNVLAAITSGKFDYEEYENCVTLSRQAANTVFEFYKESMSKKLLKSV